MRLADNRFGGRHDIGRLERRWGVVAARCRWRRGAAGRRPSCAVLVRRARAGSAPSTFRDR